LRLQVPAGGRCMPVPPRRASARPAPKRISGHRHGRTLTSG